MMDTALYLRSAAVLVLVLGLIVAMVWAFRRFGFGGLALRPMTRRRLAVVESLPIDAKRRLLLVRRDGAEHLLLVGGGADLVVESAAAPAPSQEESRP